MVCEHLKNLENELINANIKITYRGQVWSKNCREWVYFDCYLDKQSIEKRFNFPDFIEYHEHRGTHDGQAHLQQYKNEKAFITVVFGHSNSAVALCFFLTISFVFNQPGEKPVVLRLRQP